MLWQQDHTAYQARVAVALAATVLLVLALRLGDALASSLAHTTRVGASLLHRARQHHQLSARPDSAAAAALEHANYAVAYLVAAREVAADEVLLPDGGMARLHKAVARRQRDLMLGSAK